MPAIDDAMILGTGSGQYVGAIRAGQRGISAGLIARTPLGIAGIVFPHPNLSGALHAKVPTACDGAIHA